MEFDDLVQERRSFRSYESGHEISTDQVKELISTTLLAPSWKNSETGRYYVATSAEMVQKVREALPSFNQNSTANACAYVVTAYVKNVSGHTNGQPDNELGNAWGAYDLGLQNAYLILKAKEMGFDSLIMGLRDANRLRDLFHIPENHEISCVIALGKGSGVPSMRSSKGLEEVCEVY